MDTGVPNCEARFVTALAKMGLALSDVDLIVVTHGHFDHAGNADKLRKLCNAPVLIHEREAKFCAGEEKMKLCPTGWLADCFFGQVRRNLPSVISNLKSLCKEMNDLIYRRMAYLVT